MYRYTVDNAVTYTSEDFVLFRESPFACWMERLTLENPDHGILPDSGSQPPGNIMERQDDIADTLRSEGRNVVLVNWDMDEARRRSATLEAMRQGADFIVNGQLALGPLSGSANLLMRTSGYSELGTYLYVPCDTQGKTDLHSAFRLCFLADLLHSLQGQLPPQMLIIRGGSDVVPLQTEEHIYHYRAVKQRFMNAMREFRKHRMPDPAESSHFGRWSDCAHEVLKQRALNGPEQFDQEQDEEHSLEGVAPEALVAQGGGAVFDASGGLRIDGGPTPTSVAGDARRAGDSQVRSDVESTLAEQASRLAPSSFSERAPSSVPGYTPNLARVMTSPAAPGGRRRGDRIPEESAPSSGHSDVALENLEFIGSRLRSPEFCEPLEVAAPPEFEPASDFDVALEFDLAPDSDAAPEFELAPELEVAPALNTENSEAPIELPATSRSSAHPLDSVDFGAVAEGDSVVDRDESSPAPLPAADSSQPRPAPRFGWDALDEDADSSPEKAAEASAQEADTATFSDSLITNDRYRD